jgi:hypothetical protein
LSTQAGGPRGGFDQAAAAAQRHAESKRAFQQAQQPRTTWTDPKGTTQRINPEDRRVIDLRRQLDRERWANRTYREQETFRDYTTRPPVVYHDPYSTFFWLWLLDRSLDQRAAWAYHHRDDMDPQRYQDLLRRDQKLQGRIEQLEKQGTPPDPGYSPPDLDPDLMYTDDYVQAVYNPEPGAPVFWSGLRALFFALLALAVLAFLVWLIFFKRWGAVGTP